MGEGEERRERDRVEGERGAMASAMGVVLRSHIGIPDFGRLLCDSGKLRMLDGLLQRLHGEGHRVLVYCQMTKMMDILEDYLQFRKFRYHRLDGQTKLADRRDMVHNFQTSNDTFVFLLSTRAGGLGINLTAADTVVFYDSDWNPTMDAQAMDRAHRLGQTRPVFVYRLITENTIEERIMKRAQHKHNVCPLLPLLDLLFHLLDLDLDLTFFFLITRSNRLSFLEELSNKKTLSNPKKSFPSSLMMLKLKPPVRSFFLDLDLFFVIGN